VQKLPEAMCRTLAVMLCPMLLQVKGLGIV